MQVEFHDMDVGRDANGRVVFASGGLPGERAQVEIDEQNKSFARGHVVELSEVSPQRIPPPCPYFERCGGCDWQHCDYDGQLGAKRNHVVQTLSRIGGFERSEIEAITAPCVPSPRDFNYRNKADFVIGGRYQSGFEVGFFERASHRLVDIETCPIQIESNNALLAAARESLRRDLVSPFDAKSGRGVLRRLVARTSSEGESILVAVTTGETWPQAFQWARWMREQVPHLVGVLHRQGRDEAPVLDGRDWLEERVDGLRLRVRGDGFFQINTSITPALLQTARQMMSIEGGERAVDLFCGVGLFGLALARDGAQVLGIESSPRAIEDARHNATLNGLKAEFRVGDAARELKKLKRGEWSKVLLDPPREGAAACMPALLNLAPQTIVYVSCDVATLARDLKVLCRDYEVREVAPLDLFPQTTHVETVARLTRRKQ